MKWKLPIRKRLLCVKQSPNEKQADSLKNRLYTKCKKDTLSLTIQLSEKQDKLKQPAIAVALYQSVELSKKEFQQRQAKKERSIYAKFITRAFNLLAPSLDIEIQNTKCIIELL